MSSNVSRTFRIPTSLDACLRHLAKSYGGNDTQVIIEQLFFAALYQVTDRPITAKLWEKTPEERDAIYDTLLERLKSGEQAKRGELLRHLIEESLERGDFNCSNCKAELDASEMRHDVGRAILDELLQASEED